MTTANQIPMIYNLLNNINNFNSTGEESNDGVMESENETVVVSFNENLENNENELSNNNTDNQVLPNSSTENIASNSNSNMKVQEPSEKAKEILNILNSNNETFKMFQTMRKSEIMTLIQANIFSNFMPIWKLLNKNDSNRNYMYTPRDNIFNTYVKISKLFKNINNQDKIKDTNKSK